MSGNKEFQETQPISTDHNQRQNKEDAVSIKKCISSDLKLPFTSPSGVTAGFAGSIVDVDGHYGDQQHYLSHTRRFQRPGVHKSEPLRYYSPVSTSVGVPNETVSGSVFAKHDPKSYTSVKQNSLKSTHRNGGLTSSLSKPTTYTREETEILNKAPHLRSNFTAATSPTGRFSSFANPRSHVFHATNCRPNTFANHRPNTFANHRPNTFSNHRANTSINYRPNGIVSNVTDKFLLGDKFRSGESEKSKEMTRGPRCYQNNVLPKSSVVKDEFSITVCRDQYNLPDFQTEYEAAKFYMIKSFNEDDIHKGIKYDVWTSTPNGNKKLNAAFHDAEAKFRETGTSCPVFLFFSVNASGQFVGVAEMLGPVDFKKDMKFWKLDKYNGFFPIKWHIIKDVPNPLFHHITLQNNENKCVTFSRDTQEIGLKEGVEMLSIFKSYSAKTCLLDDFDFYENRDKLHHSQRVTERASPPREVYFANDNLHHSSNVRARERKREMQSSGSSKQVSGLVNLTKNLSLNPSRRRDFR